jgi:hypothetical protein
MRILNILSGVAVLLTSIAYGHLLHHLFLGTPRPAVYGFSFVAGMTAGSVVGILSFIGGCLLLKRAR